jgi:hypothetical protein
LTIVRHNREAVAHPPNIVIKVKNETKNVSAQIFPTARVISAPTQAADIIPFLCDYFKIQNMQRSFQGSLPASFSNTWINNATRRSDSHRLNFANIPLSRNTALQTNILFSHFLDCEKTSLMTGKISLRQV